MEKQLFGALRCRRVVLVLIWGVIVIVFFGFFAVICSAIFVVYTVTHCRTHHVSVMVAKLGRHVRWPTFTMF